MEFWAPLILYKAAHSSAFFKNSLECCETGIRPDAKEEKECGLIVKMRLSVRVSKQFYPLRSVISCVEGRKVEYLQELDS